MEKEIVGVESENQIINLIPYYGNRNSLTQSYSYERSSSFALIHNELNQIYHQSVTCKDYFQDLFYHEYVEKSPETFVKYGFNWKKTGDFEKRDEVKIYFKSCKYFTEGYVKHNNCQLLLNAFDKFLGFEKTSKVEIISKNELIVTADIEYTKYTVTNSLLFALIRISINFDKKINLQNIRSFIKLIEKVDSDVNANKELTKLIQYKQLFLHAIVNNKLKTSENLWGNYANNNAYNLENIHSYTGIFSFLNDYIIN
jgi:hypothetical protein